MSPMRPDLVACWLHRVRPAGELEILLIHRAPGRLYPGLWQCVTGRLETGERIIEGALREVAEETGLGPAEIEAVFETDIVNWFHESSVDALLCEAVFAAKVRPGASAVMSIEHDDHEWLAPDAAKVLVTWPAYERAIDTITWLLANPAKAEAFRVG